jgi:hypothetical protein
MWRKIGVFLALIRMVAAGKRPDPPAILEWVGLAAKLGRVAAGCVAAL